MCHARLTVAWFFEVGEQTGCKFPQLGEHNSSLGVHCKRQTVPMFPWVVAHLLSEAKATDMRVYSPKIRNCWLSVRQINYKNKRGLLLADSSQEQFCVLLYEQYRRSIKLINLCVIRQ